MYQARYRYPYRNTVWADNTYVYLTRNLSGFNESMKLLSSDQEHITPKRKQPTVGNDNESEEVYIKRVGSNAPAYKQLTFVKV